MPSEKNILLKRETVPNPITVDLTQEKTLKPPRVVIFGSRISGAYGAATAFEGYLAAHGVGDAQVDAVRDAAFISRAFYNTPPEEAPRELPAPRRDGVMRWLGRTLLRRDVAVQEEAGKDLPQGVVVFPEMRQYTPDGSGMFIPSPRKYIQDLCDKHGVPVIFMQDVHSEAELSVALSGFELGAGPAAE